MIETRETGSPATDADAGRGWSVAALVIGAIVAATAVSGLLNEVPETTHPLWIVPAAAVLGACLTVIVSVLRRLTAPASPPLRG